MKKLTVTTSSPEETIKFGKLIGTFLCGGDIVSLNGEFSAGKTWLAKGIALGLKVPNYMYVNSPAFDLIHEYEGEKLPVYHIDFYRLDLLLAEDVLWLNEYLENEGVCIIEWGDKFIDQLTNSYLRIEIKNIDFSSLREIIISSSDEKYEFILNKINDVITGN